MRETHPVLGEKAPPTIGQLAVLRRMSSFPLQLLRRGFEAIFVVSLTVTALGQSYFHLSNRQVPVLDAPVLDEKGAPLAGTNYLAELWGSAEPHSLAPLRDGNSGQRVFATVGAYPFGATAGYFWNSSPLVLWDVRPWSDVWLQVRVWDSRLGTNYESVVALGLGGYSESPLFVGQGTAGPLCDPPCVPALLTGLRSSRVLPGVGILMRGIRVHGKDFVVEWFGGFDAYQLQQKDDVSREWQNVGLLTRSTSATNTLAGMTRFFRVLGYFQTAGDLEDVPPQP